MLFDFDGTLADSAPDLAAALNRMRSARGLAPLAAARVRPFASMGARGLLRAGFGLTPQDADYPALRDEFLGLYEKDVCVETRLFPQIPELLRALEERAIAWGIVTNKARRFTERLVPLLELKPRCAVSGDSTPHLKPHPAALLLAAEQLDLPPGDCIYVGDDLRDVQAARAAGMRSVAVGWRYHGGAEPKSWNADVLISEPLDLLLHL